jgi:hypothetical protein
MWKLQGGSNLEAHVGHKVQVTGTSDWDGSEAQRSPAAAAGTTAPGAGATAAIAPRTLDVQAVRMVASSCP